MSIFLCRRHVLSASRRVSLNSKRNNGYIVLVPEIGEETGEKNPLIQDDGLPEFNKLTVENCKSSICKQTFEFEAGILEIEQAIEKQQCNDIFRDVFEPIERLNAPLNFTWGLAKTLFVGNNSLLSKRNYLEMHDRAKKARAYKYSRPIIHKAASDELKKDIPRSNEETRILQKFALEGNLNGLNLNATKKAQLEENWKKLAAETVKFKQKIEVATNQFQHYIRDGTVVKDFPLHVLRKMAQNAREPYNAPWKITLDRHIYKPVFEYCPDREVRWNVWQAIVSRGSGYSNSDLSTSLHLEEIRSIRRDIAKVLGFETFVDMSMETKMAGNIDSVKQMISTLLARAKPAQDQELQSLYDFALEQGFKSSQLELWDVPYWRRKQLNSLYDYSEEQYRQYFPLPKVLDGLFGLCEKLFNITIKRRSDVTIWHKDVQFYDIFEPHSSAPIAGFYLDPYARHYQKIEPQQDGDWMVGIRSQSRIVDQRPLAALIFSFQVPTNEKPCLLTFKEVSSLFHKFGLGLQHLLTRTTYSEVAGLSNVEWDASEVSGHVLTHWLFNKSVIDSISSHCDSEDKLPQHMFETLLSVHKHMAGSDLSRELYLSALDLELHSSKTFWLDIVKELWPQYRSFTLHKIDSHPCSFTQIFCREWAAAYYSHIWSRMIAADVYSAFHEVQGDEQQIVDVGKRFRDTFLALGGSCHPSQVFRHFRGRDPSPKALLSSLGLKKIKTDQ